MDIRTLDNTSLSVANSIHEIMQVSYKQEAMLLGLTSFPPLEKSASDIASDEGIFYGLSVESSLVGLLHFNAGNIDSLVVDPDHQQKGIASRLLQHLLDTSKNATITVTTAKSNLRAVRLYEKFGFQQTGTTSKRGIMLIHFAKPT